MSADKKTCPVGSVANCAIYSAAGVCETCSERFFKASGTSCVLGTIPDCLTYSATNVCSKCIDEKMPSLADATKTPAITAGGICVAGTVDNCKVYSSNGQCGTCTLGFSGASCTTTLTNCKAFMPLSATLCRTCVDNWMPASNRLSCTDVGLIPNCLSYSENKKCSVCSNYYYPNFDFTKCIQDLANMPNCKTYAFKGVCTVCDIGFKPSADRTKC